MVTVSHITKRFGSTVAVSDVSFEIQKGEIVGLLGPNGAGKTTTMRVMTGYYAPDEGTVAIGGVSLSEDACNAKKHVGYLPESNPLYKDMLVAEYLLFIARVRSIPRASYRSAFDRVVADTGINEVFYRTIGELSKGYRQRVGLAGALIGDPSVLILDEPTEGLDPNQRTDLRTLIARLAQNKTILVSTHVIAEAQAMADRIVVLRGGRVAAVGTVEELSGSVAGTTYTVVLSGKGVVEAVRALSMVAQVDECTHENDRVQLSVRVTDVSSFPPALSKLVASKHFVLWQLAPESKGLEKAFAELTLSGDTPSA